MKYAFFDAEGRVESAHNDSAVKELPQGAIRLTDEQFEARFDLLLSSGALVVSPVEPAAPTNLEQKRKRAAAYASEADPLFFKVQRGEVPEADWLAKIEEIRTRYPYSEI